MPGGARRQDSVFNAFQAVAAGSDVVVIHDAARPFASAELVSRTIAAAAESGAAVAAVPSRDTVKLVAGMESGAGRRDARFVAETLPRETIYLAQTPQAFRVVVLREALALSEAAVDATDEAALAERAGRPGYLIDDASFLKREWFEGKNAVGVTAGASAPEHLVRRVCDWFRAHGVEVVGEERPSTEDVAFRLPTQVRRIVPAA